MMFHTTCVESFPIFPGSWVFHFSDIPVPDDTDFRVYIANILLLPLLLIVSQVDVQRTGYKVTNL